MKLLICMVLLIFIANSQQRTFPELKQIWQSYILKHSEKCLKETGADYNKAMRLIPYGEFVDDQKLKCFLLCIADNLSTAYEDGSVRHHNALDIINMKDPEILQNSNLVQKCFDIKLIDPCESYYAFSECVFNTLEKVMTKNETE